MISRQLFQRCSNSSLLKKETTTTLMNTATTNKNTTIIYPYNYNNRNNNTRWYSAKPLSTEDERTSLPHPYIIKVSVLLERYPLIFKELSKLEKECEHVIQAAQNRECLYTIEEIIEKQKFTYGKAEDQTSVIKTAKYVPTSRVTVADQSNDLKSPFRKLDEFLYFVVKDKKTGKWQLPCAQRKSDEISLRAVAERAVIGLTSDLAPIKFYTYSHSPSAYITEEYKKEVNGVKGEKTFVYKILCQDEDIELDSENLEEHMWLSKDELGQHLPKEITDTLKIIAN